MRSDNFGLKLLAISVALVVLWLAKIAICCRIK